MGHNFYGTSKAGMWEANRMNDIEARSKIQAQRRHEMSMARIANPSRDRTPSAKLRARLGLSSTNPVDKILAANAPPTLKRKKKARF